jgi:hypothetical protein
MKKILLEELNQIKYMFGYKRGVVVSEQTALDPVNNPAINPNLKNNKVDYDKAQMDWDKRQEYEKAQMDWDRKQIDKAQMDWDRKQSEKLKSSQQKPTVQIPIPAELKNVDGVKNFQMWLDNNVKGWHPKYGELNSDIKKGFGKFGPNTSKNWKSYKDDYLKNPNAKPLTKKTPEKIEPTSTEPRKPELKLVGVDNIQQPIQNTQTTQNVNIPVETPESFYKRMYDMKHIKGEGRNKIRYVGPKLLPNQEELLKQAMENMGYEFKREKNSGKIIYVKK